MCLEQAVTIHALLNENICPYHLLGYSEGMSNISFFSNCVKIQVRYKNIKHFTLSKQLFKPDALNHIFVTLNAFFRYILFILNYSCIMSVSAKKSKAKLRHFAQVVCLRHFNLIQSYLHFSSNMSGKLK